MAAPGGRITAPTATTESRALGIKTPVAPAPADGAHGGKVEDGGRSTASHRSGGSHSSSHRHGGSSAPRHLLPYIPMASYVMPPPTWRVKPQFASWEVDHTRFEILKLMGKGSYGSVAEAYDHLTHQRVAIKKIHSVFEVFENAKRIYREIRILRLLNHQNIIRIVHIQQPSDLLNFSDLYVIFECMDTDFQRLTKDDTQCLTIPHVRWFLYQLLLSVKYLHSAKILHRDIKPANILLTESCDLKLCDFGLARTMEDESDEGDEDRDIIGVAGKPSEAEQSADPSAATAGGGHAAHSGAAGDGSGSGVGRTMTKHVVTRWYRAPELPLYNDGMYTYAIDMWSVGCCYAEMLGMLDTGDPECRYDRHALFPGGACYPMSKDKRDKSGKERKDQLIVILEVLGKPTSDEIRRVKTSAAQEFLASLTPRPPEDLNKRYPTAGPEAIDLLRRMLRLLPEDRATVDDALAHSFLAPVRRPQDEVVRREGPIHFRRIVPEHIRELMVEEIRAYNAHIPDNWRELAENMMYEWRLSGTPHSSASGSVGSGSPADAMSSGHR